VGSFVITLREGFEAALVAGLIFAYLSKTDRLREHARAVWFGISLAVLASAGLGALLFFTVGELEGNAESIYEGSAMIIAAGVVTWMVFWMRRQAATIGQHLRSQVSESIKSGGGVALAAVAFVGVAREGIETALFLFASVQDSGALISVIAGLAGLAAGVWRSPDEFLQSRTFARFEPGDTARADEYHDGWRRAVRTALAWARDRN